MKKFFFSFGLVCVLINGFAQNPKLVMPIGHPVNGSSDKVLYSHDRKWLFTFDNNGNVYMWNTKTNKIQYNLFGHSDRIKYATISHNDSFLVTVSNDKSVLIWKTYDGDSIARLKWINNVGINYADISPDDKQIVTGSSDGCIQLWNLDGSIQKFKMYVHDAISEVKYCNNGKSIISCGFDSLIHSLSVSDLNIERDYFYVHWGNKKINTYENLHVSEDNKILMASAFYGGVLLWNYETGDFIKRYDAVTNSSYVLTNKSNGFLYESRSLTNQFVNLQTLSESTLIETKNYLNQIAISDNDSLVIGFVDDSIARVLSLYDTSYIKEIKVRGKYPQIKITPDNRFALVYGNFYDIPEVYDINTGKIFCRLKAKVKDFTGAFFNSSNSLLFFEEGGIAQELNLESGKLIQRKEFGNQIYGLNALNMNEFFIARLYNQEEEEYEHSLFDLKSNSFTYKYVSYSDLANINKSKTMIITPRDRGLGVDLFNIKENKKYAFSSADNAVRLLYTSALNFLDNDKKIFLAGSKNIEIWDIKSGTSIAIIEPRWGTIFAKANKVILSHKDSVFIIAGFQSLRLYNAQTCELIKEIVVEGGYINQGIFTNNDHEIWIKNNGSIMLIDLESGHILSQCKLDGALYDINFDRKWALIYDQSILNIFDLNTKKIIFSVAITESGGRVIFKPELYYMADKQGINVLGFSEGYSHYDFDQFDLKNNRPDLVLKAMGNKDTGLINAYFEAYLKRIKKAGFSITQLSAPLHVPEMEFTVLNTIPLIVKESTLRVHLKSVDGLYKLKTLNFWLNGNPVFGQKGLDLRGNSHKLDTFIQLELSEGKNKIQASIINEKGGESYRESIETVFEPDHKIVSKIYYIGIGVSKYIDTVYNLKYADKDVKDLSQCLKLKYPEIGIMLLVNEQATIENIKALKEILLKTSVNDKIIVSFSGHGVIDSAYNFYFATHNLDFLFPAKKGLSYDNIAWLLDSIPARNKLILIDACHSGELDKEVYLEVNNFLEHPADSNVKSISNFSKGSKLINEKKGKTSLSNSFELMQDLFANIGRGNGSTIISASAGTEFAYESNNWNNGVFTYSVVKGLSMNLADLNLDGQTTVSELSDYVGAQVQTLTKGSQKPNSRQINFENDFIIW